MSNIKINCPTCSGKMKIRSKHCRKCNFKYRIGKYPCSERKKNILRIKALKRMSDSKFKKKNLDAINKAKNSKSYKRKMRQYWNSKEFRAQCSNRFKGAKNPRWNGGKTIHKGYLLISKPNHPLSDCHGYVKKHRIIVEKQIGRFLKRTEVVHHLGKKLDCRPHMLMAFTSHSSHMKFEFNKIINPKEILFDGRKIKH